MTNPFINDPFAMVWQAFQNLYPDKKCNCVFDVLEKNEDGDTVYGETWFNDDGSVEVVVDCTLKLSDAIEIFAHELAHVAVGADEAHDEKWQEAFDKIFIEYNRIGNEMFDRHTPVEDAINGKACYKEKES